MFLNFTWKTYVALAINIAVFTIFELYVLNPLQPHWVTSFLFKAVLAAWSSYCTRKTLQDRR